MKTLEERAEKYAEKIIGYIPDDDEPNAYADFILQRNAYANGALEQKAIDNDAMHAIVEEKVLKAIERQKGIDIAKTCTILKGKVDLNWFMDAMRRI